MIQEGSEDPWARTECQSGLHWQTAGADAHRPAHVGGSCTAHHLVPAMWRGRDEDEARHSSCCLPSHSVEGFVGFYVG